MLTLPLLMFLGLPPQAANGTNRVSVALQSVSAVASFLRAGASHLGLSLRLSVPAVAGSLVGAWLALKTDDALFEAILIAVMAGSAVLMLLPQPRVETRALTAERLTPPSTWRCSPSASMAASSRSGWGSSSSWCSIAC